MDQTDHEALMERIEEVHQEVEISRRAVEWLEDHTQDPNLMSSLGLIRRNLGRLEGKLFEIIGYRPLDINVPD